MFRVIIYISVTRRNFKTPHESCKTRMALHMGGSVDLHKENEDCIGYMMRQWSLEMGHQRTLLTTYFFFRSFCNTPTMSVKNKLISISCEIGQK
jgi:hypothetical protein